MARYIRKRTIVTEFFQRVEDAACPGMGPAGIQHVFFGDANYRSSRRGNRSSPGPKTMMDWARQRYKWDAGGGHWKTRVVAVNEHCTSQCCPWCGARQKGGRAKQEAPTRGAPGEPGQGGVAVKRRRRARRCAWVCYRSELARHARWEQRLKEDERYSAKSRAVRGLKICCSRSCGRRLNSRDGGAAWCIGLAGRAEVEKKDRPGLLRRVERPDAPTVVLFSNVLGNNTSSGGTVGPGSLV